MPVLKKVAIDQYQAPGRRIASQGTDCDDSDPDRAPHLQEVCDGKDNNCDGDIDENVARVFYEDRDGDGFGNPSRPVYGCNSAPGLASDGNDCDDNDPQRNPAVGCS